MTAACVSILLGATGCEKSPFGADAGSESGSSNASSESMSRDRSISRNGSSSASITMPAYPLLVSAARSIVDKKTDEDIYDVFVNAVIASTGSAPEFEFPENYDNLSEEDRISIDMNALSNAFDRAYSYLDSQPGMCKSMSNSDAMKKLKSIAGKTLPESYNYFIGEGGENTINKLLLQMAEINGIDVIPEPASVEDENKEQRKKIKSFLKNNCPSQADNINKELAELIAFAGTPCMGWPGIMEPYARAATSKIESANIIASEALKGISANTLKNPEHAKKILADRLLRLTNDRKFVAAVKEAGDLKSKGNVMLDLSGSEYPIQFTIGGESNFGCSKDGWHMFSNGIEFFGGGKVMGQDITLALESAISTSETRTSGTASSGDSGTRQNSGARVSTPQ